MSVHATAVISAAAPTVGPVAILRELVAAIKTDAKRRIDAYPWVHCRINYRKHLADAFQLAFGQYILKRFSASPSGLPHRLLLGQW
jgi:hypothetical protein